MVDSGRVLRLGWAGILCVYAVVILLSTATGIIHRFVGREAYWFVVLSALLLGAVGIVGLARPGLMRWTPANGFLVFAVPLAFVPLGLRYSGPPITAFAGNGGAPFAAAAQETAWSTETVPVLPSGSLPQVVPRELSGAPDDPPLASLEKVEFGEELFYRYHSLLYEQRELFEGRRVVLAGFVGTEPAFPANRYYIARRLLWCCTADAVLLAFLVDAGRTSVPREGAWVEIEATVAATTLGGASRSDTPVPLLRAERIREIDTPEFEYVLPF